MDLETHLNSVTGYEKRDHITHFLIFHFKTLITWKVYRPFPGLGGASTRVNHVRKLLFYASIWQFTVQYRRLTLASNVGSGK